jgi:cytochrome c553
LRFALDKGPMEPIGQRIIEVPQDAERARNHDSHSGFVAYVPVGSVKKGQDLVKTGGMHIAGGKIVPGNTVECATCHGVDLRGGGQPGVPSIAGRSPIYTYRQMYDFKVGKRTGPSAALMMPSVEKLISADMIAIAAYVATQNP